MPLHRSSHGFSRAIWTIRNGMQVGKMAVKGVRAIKARRAAKRTEANRPAAVKKVRSRLETLNPAYKHKDKYFNKETPAGQRRRAAFAKQVKAHTNPALRPARKKTGNVHAVATQGGFHRKPYSGKITISKGMSGHQIKRNIVRHEIKKNSAEVMAKYSGNVKAKRISAAREIKGIRKATSAMSGGRPITRSQFKPSRTNKYVKAATRILSK